MKKVLSVVLSVCMLLSIIGGMSITANATSKTSDEAISWVKSQLGKTVGSGQCVALINSYYSFLGVSPVSGNGCDYATNSLPSGWTRTKGGTPQKGDILVYNANSSNPYGHVGIYEGDYSHYHQNVSGQYVECITGWKYNGFTNSYWGCIHPNFSGSLGKPTNLRVQVRGGIVQLFWNAASGANCYDVILTKPNGSVKYLHASGTSKDIRNLAYGTYKVEVQSLYRPNGSSTGQTVGPHSDVLTFDYNMQSAVNVKFERVGTTITVTWDAADGANCYDVIVKNPKNETNWYHTNTTSKTFTDCIPGQYVFDIQSLYRVNNSSTGQKVGPHSGEFPYLFALEAPKNLKASNDADDNLYLEWDAVDGATCYDVIVEKPDGNTDWYHSHENYRLINNLAFGTYTINIQSLYRENEGTSSQFQVVGSHSEKLTYNYQKHQHTVVTDAYVAPTCTQPGKTEGSHCSTCGAIIVAQNTISATGHSFVSDKQYCQNGCGTVNPNYVAPHTHTWNSGVVTQAATCTANGIRTFTCSGCGETKTETIGALGHAFETITLSAANCVNEGLEKEICTRCEYYQTNRIPALGHDYQEVLTQPTATTLGYTTHICARCSDTFVDSYTSPTGKLTLKCAARTANAEKVQWNAVKTASGYQVQISNVAGTAWSSYANVKAGVTAYTFKNLAAGSNYKFRVRFYIMAGDKNYFSPWSATLNSPTLPAGTAFTKLTPAKRAFAAQWKKSAVTGYQLQYATNAKFSKAVTKTVKGASKYSLAVKNLKGGARYYVRIRTYQAIGGAYYYSTWSAAKVVTTKK